MRKTTHAHAASTTKNTSASWPDGAEADEHPDVHDREDDRGVEEPSVPVRPRLEVAAPLAPEQEEEERDREEEGDAHEPADGREHGLEREDHDDERDERHDPEPPHERRNPFPELSHDPVMKARTESAAARSVVPPNQRSRRRTSGGA